MVNMHLTLTGYDSEKCATMGSCSGSVSPLSPLGVGHENWRRGILVFAVAEASSVKSKILVLHDIITPLTFIRFDICHRSRCCCWLKKRRTQCCLPSCHLGSLRPFVRSLLAGRSYPASLGVGCPLLDKTRASATIIL